jgi:hypothetical protein
LLTFTCRACPQKPPCTEETLDLTKWVSWPWGSQPFCC